MDPKELRGFRCHRPELEAFPLVYLCLNTLAMGDSQAVELAQTAHIGILSQAGILDEHNLVTMDMSVPRTRFFGGVVIDDLVLFEIMLKEHPFTSDSPSVSKESLDSALSEYQRVGLLPHPKKTFCEDLQGEFWGCQFDGEQGSIQANLKRVVPVMSVTQRIVQMGVCTMGLLEIIVGSWTAIFLFRRRLLSLFNVVYAAIHGECSRQDVFRLSTELKEELMLLLALAPLAVTLLRVPNCSSLFCSDASDWGIGITKAELPPGFEREVHRHKLKKSVWAKLLSPLQALSRLKGILPADDELPEGQMLASHPLWIELASALPFEEVLRKRCREGLHINVLELRAMLTVEKEVARSSFPSRYFVLADSQVSLGVWTKGRSSSLGLNQELQQSLATWAVVCLAMWATYLRNSILQMILRGELRFELHKKPCTQPSLLVVAGIGTLLTVG